MMDSFLSCPWSGDMLQVLAVWAIIVLAALGAWTLVMILVVLLGLGEAPKIFYKLESGGPEPVAPKERKIRLPEEPHRREGWVK
jgi:hypothetical protein